MFSRCIFVQESPNGCPSAAEVGLLNGGYVPLTAVQTAFGWLAPPIPELRVEFISTCKFLCAEERPLPTAF